MLSEPEYKTLAISHDQWKECRNRYKPITGITPDSDCLEIQVWYYPPSLIAKDFVVDPLSLYLSLKESPDERVQSSLDDMLKDLSW